jgi:uncharacterized repeat protein (TIGR01451 family)
MMTGHNLPLARPGGNALTVLAAAILILLATHSPAGATQESEHVPTEMEKVIPAEFNGDMRELAKLPAAAATGTARPYRPLLRPPRQTKSSPSLAAPALPSFTPTLTLPLAPMPAPVRNFSGLNFNDTCTGGQCGAGYPPDTNGDVGPNHYIEAVNNAYAIYSKSGTLLASFTENNLWSTGGTNPCNGNSQGDPVVVYDPLADRWILTHFAFGFDTGGNAVSPFYECIAVSKTADPVAGGWWLYPLRMDPGGTGRPPVGTLNDYPKFGIWTDCLYMSANEFTGNTFAGVAYASFSRSDLYSGAPLTWSLGFLDSANNNIFTMIPSNLRGLAPASRPALGTPNFFVSESATGSAFEVRKFTAGPNCGSGGSLGAATLVSQDLHTVPCTDNTCNNADIVPQPGTTNKLDTVDDRLMQKVQYRRVGGNESLWVVHTVIPGTNNFGANTALQWAELDVTGGTVATVPVQQQIYSPDTALFRWMPSLAVDKNGNMAVGYSTSNGTAPNFPSIAYSGRLTGDPPGTLPQSETQLIAGAGSQTITCGNAPCGRWGDYTGMSVDPVDDCTFWYTSQYYSSVDNGKNGNWQTRIGSFKFPGCLPPPDLVIAKTHSGNFAQGEVGARYTLTVTNSGAGPTDGSVVTVTDTLPTGLTATAVAGTGWNCTLAPLACTRGDVLAAGAAYPAITLTVNVAADAPASVTNSATVAGGGEFNTTNSITNDPTAITAAPLLNVTLNGNGGGAVTVTGQGLKTVVSNVTFSVPVPAGTGVTLHAAPDQFSLFSGWTGACTGTGDCSFTMTGPANTTAPFAIDSARSVLLSTTNFATILAAHQAASPSGSVIETWGITFPEILTLDQGKTFTLKGGFNAAYTSNPGITTVGSPLTVTNGAVTAENLAVK